MSETSNRNSGCLTAFFGIFLRRTTGDQSHTNGLWPYKTRDDFLTNAELSFYGVLTSTIGSRATICPKVGLRDLFWVATSQNQQAHWNQISQKHVDFLLCNPQTMQPLLAIELDDSSHASPRRQHRDADVDRIFEAAGLPLLRIPTQRSYQTQALSAVLNPYLNDVPGASISPQVEPVTAPPDKMPSCPKCGARMVVRVARQGQHKGQAFYACPNYPQCKTAMPIE
jgi:hypothetical protein